MTTAAGWLTDLNTYYTPTTTQFSGARGHRSSIETRLNTDLGVSEMFEIGSLRHGTGVYTFSDADYLVALKGFRPESPWTMLNKVKASLEDRFKFTTVGTRRPAVVCAFSDGVVEVVPAFASTGSGYWIADPTGGWMLTHPRNHNSWVDTVNKKHDGAAKKLARQLKIWKYRRNVPVSSCYLEMRAAKHIDGESYYNSTWDLHAVLKKLHDNSLVAMNDPTGLGSRFTAYSSEANKTDALSKLSTAVTRAAKARDYATAGDHANAIAQLKLLFNR
ncbi:SMODS domain-containing nucleotidyltransferase [Microbacterium oleivorans]|uniref:Nucleotidyltransferase n=1 Tax=Microbacterium oleivorans TaxID=273677 RepID=A0A4R5YPF6_9MICO|nr:nucleotidyltransferase [Microbacterium oleivorans]TDL45227.1 nucleotidyltransferase [Microbacterium oleivorans]